MAAWGCGGKASNGSDGSSNRAACESDLDCASGACVDGRCTDPEVTTGGIGGTAGFDGTVVSGGAGSGGTVSGNAGAPPTGGASCGGAFVFTPDISPSTGGSSALPPTCAVDTEGFATATLDVLCDWFRCPSQAMDIVRDLDCSEVVMADAEGITLVSGCGFETVKISGTGFTYEATFDATEGALTALQVEQESLYDLTGCLAYAFEAGDARPDCASEMRFRCVRPADAETACREPGQDGCAACCTSWSSGGGCLIATSSGPTKRYDTYWGEETPCACNCPPCAECTTEAEYNLRTYPEKPECDCPAVGAGGASGTGGMASTGGNVNEASPCELYCTALNPLLAACPDVAR